MKVGKLIRARRMELGLTQKELAERCGYTNKSTISRIESGERDIPVSQLKKIAAALGMKAEDLVIEASTLNLEELLCYNQAPKYKRDMEEIARMLKEKPELVESIRKYTQYLYSTMLTRKQPEDA